MKLFNRTTPVEVEPTSTVRELEKQEQSRRKWCIEQAVASEAQDIFRLAEKIYEYVYGGRE